MTFIWLTAFVAFALLNWLAAARQNMPLEYIAKPAAAASLIAFAASTGSPAWLIVALACCLVGDIFLMLPGNYFVAGLSAFLLGHVAYNLTFTAGLTERLLWAAAVVVLTLPATMRIVRALVEDRLLAAGVVAYMGVICLMAGSAIASGSLAAAIGALLFIASDTLIAWDMFVKKVPRAHLWVMVSYHVAQLLLVFALRAA